MSIPTVFLAPQSPPSVTTCSKSTQPNATRDARLRLALRLFQTSLLLHLAQDLTMPFSSSQGAPTDRCASRSFVQYETFLSFPDTWPLAQELFQSLSSLQLHVLLLPQALELFLYALHVQGQPVLLLSGLAHLLPEHLDLQNAMKSWGTMASFIMALLCCCSA